MSRFAEVDDRYDPEVLEAEVLEYWDDVDAYRKTKAHRSDGESFYFLDGPPYTTGAPHMGTAWNKALKDTYIRYHRMLGYDVYDRPGYDMHGLPIENKVEEELGFETKKDIQEFGVEAFIEECKSFANENLDVMNDAFQSFGVWMDWDDPYKTVDPTYMEAAWWGFAQAHERGLVERGKRSITQCPRCETAIAKNEVEYHSVEDPSIYVKFDLSDRDGYLVIWTTTPWTIPANTFVAVDERLTYVGVEAKRDGEDELLYVAEAVVDEVMEKGGYDSFDIIEEIPGSEMVGWTYDHPLAEEVPEHPDGENSLEVYHADYVEADRTGLVHSAPGHGEDDFKRGSEIGLDLFCPVGSDGRYTGEGGAYSDTFVREANDAIIEDLEKKGLLLASETYVHDYGQCWRCDTDIIQIVTDQWFINTSEFKDDMLALLEDSDWYPGWARDNRFHDFIEESPDWNVSRQRYWGIPLPIWVPDDWSGDVEDVIVIETREELAHRVDQEIDPTTVDLHKPTVDGLTITEDGITYRRIPDVFDVWLDSGVASWAALGYPEDNRSFEELWPMDLIIEAHDQTRGWFWSLLAMGTVVFEQNPYRQVLMYGHTLAEDGRKMSKSIGNVVEPSEAIDRHGRDAMRLFLLSFTPQGEDMRFSWDEMTELGRRLNILWNVFRFPLPYMRMDGFDPEGITLEAVEDDLEVVDRWILSRLQTTIEEMSSGFEEFRHDRALKTVLEFVVEDLSRYYVQAARERMWEETDSPSKRAAYTTIHHVLYHTVVLLAPFAPFVTEKIYQTLSGSNGHETVHMADWPAPDPQWQDEELETDIQLLRAVEEAGANARQQAGRKRRWPVPRIVIAAKEDRLAEAVESKRTLLADRLNAYAVEVHRSDEQWEELAYSAEADLSVLGPEFGERAHSVMEALNDARIEAPDIESLEAEVEAILEESVTLDESMITFTAETPPDVAGTPITENGEELGTVYVDTTLTEEIETEGYAREVIRRIQEMRKELDLDVDARIQLEYSINDDRIAELVASEEDFIANEVRASEIGEVSDGYREHWEVEDVTLELAIAKI